MEKIWPDLIPVLENVPLRDDQVPAAGVDVPEPKAVSLPNADIPGGAAAAVATEQAQEQIQQQMEQLQVQQQEQQPAPALPPAAAPPAPPPGSDGITDVPLTDPMMGSGIQYRP